MHRIQHLPTNHNVSDCKGSYRECEMHINLKIFIEKINRGRIVWFSPHDSETVKVLHMILVLTSAYDCVHVSFSGCLITRWTFCEQPKEFRLKRSGACMPKKKKQTHTHTLSLPPPPLSHSVLFLKMYLCFTE
jgi:hypothetical protein